jgi:hypothetical protein
MAIGRISGPMLFSNLERQGIDLAFEGNLIYLDVTNSNVGINTSTPNADLQVVGTTQLSNIHIRGNAITSTTGKVDLGFETNVIIRGGLDGYLLSTDGQGNLAWATLSSLATQFGNIVINENSIEIVELNGNLNLYANGTGNIVAHNDFYASNIFVGNLSSFGNITAPWFLGNIISNYGRFDTLVATNFSVANTSITNSLTRIEQVHFYGNTVEGYNGSLYLSANTAADANAIVKFTGTKAIDIPSGSDAERPLNPDLGYIRFNSERGTLEWWSGTNWIQGQSYIEEQIITPSGLTNVYTLDSAPPSATSILVSINGTVQQANVAYTVAGDQITFSETPLDSDIIDIRFLAATGLATSFVGGNLTGNIYISSNTESYSSSTGGLIVEGGTGIGGNLFVGGNIIATSGNTSTSIDTGALVVIGGAGVSGNLFVGGNIVAASGDVSTSTNTGALVVIGGAGISGNLYITNTGDVSANIGAFQAYANATFGTSTYSNSNVAAYLPSDPTIANINANVGNVQANLTAFALYANAAFTVGNYGDSNVAAYLPTDANLVAFFNYANVTFDQVFTQQDAIDGNLITSKATFNANIGTLFLGNVSTNANLGAYQLYANANIGLLHNSNISTQANIGSIFNRVNLLESNVGTLHLGNISTQANLGTLHLGNISTQANIGTLFVSNAETQANIGTLFLGNISTQANLGTLHLGNISTQANIGTLFVSNAETQANLGAFQAYANSKIGSNSNSNLVVVSTTQATSIETGALVVQGGAGIAGNLYVGGNLIVSNVSYEYREVITTTETVLGNIVAASGTISSGVDTGALVVVGGAGVSGSLFISNTNDVSANIGNLHLANIALNANLGTFQTFVLGNLVTRNNDIIDINSNLGAFQTYANSKIGSNSNSNIVVVSTDASTSTVTGAIVTLGGVGVAGNLNVGQTIISSGNIVAVSDVESTNIYTGALVVKGGTGISGNVYIGKSLNTIGNIVIESGTLSTSASTGALVVAGGVGISGNLTLGGRVRSDLIPAITSIYDLGTPFFKWRDLYLAGGASIDGETSINQDLYVTGQVVSDGVSTNSVDVAGTLTAQYLAGTLTTAVQTNITQVGTITAGTWNGSTIGITHGGTGGTSVSQALNNLLPSGESLGYVLTTGGPGSYYWAAGTGGGGGGGGTLSGIFVESSRTYYTATLGQTSFTTTGNYTPGTGQLRIYQNGVRQFNSEYTEIDGNTFTLSTACAAGDVVLAEIDGFNYLTVFASNVVYSPVGGIPTGANTVQMALDSVETRKVDRAGDTMTGLLIIANANVATSTSTGALQVQGGVGIGGNLYIGGSQSTAIVATGNIDVLTGNVNATAGNIYGGRVFSAGSNVLIATSNVATRVSSLGVGTAAPANVGEIRATNDVIAYYSDDRLKTRLGNIEHALDKVKSLAGFHYHANELAQSLGYEPKPEVGVSAQEVQRVFPEIVVPAPIDENYLTVKYEKLIPVLIEAIKELSEEIDAIKRKINGN